MSYLRYSRAPPFANQKHFRSRVLRLKVYLRYKCVDVMNSSRNRISSKTMLSISIIGLLLIVLASVLTLIKDGGFWVNASATTAGAVGGVLIGAGVTGFVNLDPLQEINDKLDSNKTEIQTYIKTAKTDFIQEIKKLQNQYVMSLQETYTARVSSTRTTGCINSLKVLSQKKTIYRYFQTLNKQGEREWRMKDLSFTLSNDRQRLNTQMAYMFGGTPFSYTVQAAYIGQHLILVTEENNELDQPIVEVYPGLIIGEPRPAFSGISIRYPWGRNNTLLCSSSMLSEQWLPTSTAWEETSNGYWRLKDTERADAGENLQEMWEQGKSNAQFFL